MANRWLLRMTVFLALCLGAFSAHGDRQRVGDYVIHYSAIGTRFLAPEVAEEYGIQRSAGLGLVHVSVREHRDDGTTRPASASVKGSVGPLKETPKSLDFRTVRDNGAVYQLATFRLTHDAPMHFTLKVRADRNAAAETVRFVQRFYLER